MFYRIVVTVKDKQFGDWETEGEVELTYEGATSFSNFAPSAEQMKSMVDDARAAHINNLEALAEEAAKELGLVDTE